MAEQREKEQTSPMEPDLNTNPGEIAEARENAINIAEPKPFKSKLELEGQVYVSGTDGSFHSTTPKKPSLLSRILGALRGK